MAVAAQRPDDPSGSGTVSAPAATVSKDPIGVLSRRADFLRAARARRQGTPGFHLQARRRAPGEADGIRVGFTCSKKVGNAVARNRAKRRLREIARAILPVAGHPGWDYVLIGRAQVTADRPFEALKADLAEALRRIHASKDHASKDLRQDAPQDRSKDLWQDP
ncbi:MAG: ribonuclease P protein component [Rhodobacteraceae bacterium]|nr:ribonuclease P protein component [Paracoccaceae bacterium]MAY44290.1 ribonuclease P protein component [Paracoccaceae bacterium]